MSVTTGPTDDELRKPYTGGIVEDAQASDRVPFGEQRLDTGADEPPEQETHVVEQDVAFTDTRVTHHAMTWQEELAKVEAMEASGVEMTDAEKAYAEQVKDTAATHAALMKAEADAKAEAAAKAKR